MKLNIEIKYNKNKYNKSGKQKAECRMRNAECRKRNAECRKRNAECGIAESRLGASKNPKNILLCGFDFQVHYEINYKI